jgi:DNA-binding transcriptional ArsR family regulator
MNEETFDIRDRRNGDWFWCQNILLKAKINHTVKLTYFALCTFANKNSEKCYPGMRRIAEIAGISHRSVRYAIKDLSEANIIRIQKGLGRGNSTKYTLLKIKEANVATLEKGHLLTHKRGRNRHIKGDLGETKQRVLTNEINNTGLNLLRKKIKDLNIKSFPN